jgi:5-methylcytosine-specific restriction endonuclease McrA
MTFHPCPKPKPTLLAKRQRAADKKREWRNVQALVRARDRGRCVVCGRPGREVHHVLYRSHGGRSEPGNLALLCLRCHQDVHAHLVRLTRGLAGWISERLET